MYNKLRRKTSCLQSANFEVSKFILIGMTITHHFHASYAGENVIVSIKDLEVMEGSIASKHLKMLLGWAAFHQEELMENWFLAEKREELFPIDPLK